MGVTRASQGPRSACLGGSSVVGLAFGGSSVVGRIGGTGSGSAFHVRLPLGG
jgi:hypothetical protein